MRIRIRRLGGLTGNIALAAELDTAELPDGEATQLEHALAALPWGKSPGEPPHPDAFRYELTLPDDPARGIAVLGEAAMTGDLEPLRGHLKRDGVIESARPHR